MTASDALKYQFDTLTELIAGVRSDQLGNPTPCADWDVRGLLNHFVGGATMFAAAFAGEPLEMDPEAPAPDLVGDDPSGSWATAIDAFNRAVDQPGAVEREIQLGFGVMPGAAVLEMLKFDLTVHAWDLAQATGQAFDPPEDVVANADALAHRMINPEMRSGGAFGPEVTPPDDATPVQRLVAFTGRNP